MSDICPESFPPTAEEIAATVPTRTFGTLFGRGPSDELMKYAIDTYEDSESAAEVIRAMNGLPAAPRQQKVKSTWPGALASIAGDISLLALLSFGLFILYSYAIRS